MPPFNTTTELLHLRMTAGQLSLPFLTLEEAGTIHAAQEAIARATGSAVAGRRYFEAEELARIGAELVEMLERNAAGARGDHPAPRPSTSWAARRTGDQDTRQESSNPEPTR